MSAPNPVLSPAPGRAGWLPTLRLATQEVFDLMLGSPLDASVAPPSEADLDITSMIGLAGQLCGVLTVRCRAKSAARMASLMLGIEADQAGPEMYDAVSEICNMVAGNFKNKIAGLGDGCVLSVPTVITGSEYNLHSIVNEEMLAIFLFEGDPILVSLEVHN